MLTMVTMMTTIWLHFGYSGTNVQVKNFARPVGGGGLTAATAAKNPWPLHGWAKTSKGLICEIHESRK
jgi:hypothetical protein